MSAGAMEETPSKRSVSFPCRKLNVSYAEASIQLSPLQKRVYVIGQQLHIGLFKIIKALRPFWEYLAYLFMVVSTLSGRVMTAQK